MLYYNNIIIIKQLQNEFKALISISLSFTNGFQLYKK